MGQEIGGRCRNERNEAALHSRLDLREAIRYGIGMLKKSEYQPGDDTYRINKIEKRTQNEKSKERQKAG